MASMASPAVGGDADVGPADLADLGGSMSTWMILARGAKAGTLPVTRLSKREPRAMRRSDCCMAVTAM